MHSLWFTRAVPNYASADDMLSEICINYYKSKKKCQVAVIPCVSQVSATYDVM